MPYIKPDRRAELDPHIESLAKQLFCIDSEKGDLNYSITKLVIRYIEVKGKRYETLSNVTGVLNDVKVEFERRVVALYEDEKITENGDVYPDPRRGIK